MKMKILKTGQFNSIAGKSLKIFLVFFGLFIFMLYFQKVEVPAKDEQGNLVLVLDPGHGCEEGGENTGAASDGYVEKDINMKVANIMKAELENYEGVKVYLTHDSPDKSMSIAARARFAESVGADFVFSLHFNASDELDKYGCEVWIPSIGDYYVAGKQFAAIELEELEKLGIFNRGIKTRIGDDGDEYYGIIRECEWRKINAVIIEHCYIDNLVDRGNISSDEALEDLGKADATAVAKYFGLRGKNEDYTGYEKIDVEPPASRVWQDTTPPDVCILSQDIDSSGKGRLVLNINAVDSDGDINYYSYSMDGGKTFSNLFMWLDADDDDKISVIIDNLSVESAEMVVRVYNQYDNWAESNTISVSGVQVSNIENSSSSDTKLVFKVLKWCLHNRIMICAVVLIMVGIFSTILILKIGRKLGKRKR